ncbi:MAG: AsmA family protein [Terriglobia bacterium]
MLKRRKGILITLCIAAAFIVACVVVAPRLFQVDRYRPYVISLIEQESGRRVEIGRLGLTVFPSITIRVDDLAISNPPGFPAGNWLQVKRINARLDAGALWHHQIVIHSLDLTGPSLSLLSDAHGRWNYQAPPSGRLAAGLPSGPGSGPSNLQDSPAKPGAADPPLFSLQEISGVSLKDGSLVMANITPSGEPGPPAVKAQGISTDLKNISLAAFANPHAATTGVPAATGELHLKTLQAGSVQMVNVASSIQATPAAIQLNNVKFDFYGGHGQANILLNLAATALQYTAEGNLSGVNAAAVLANFPQARGQITGTLESRFTFSGESLSSPDPWAGKQGQGTLTVRKGRLPKLQLDKAMLDLARVAQMGPVSGDPSAFSVISLDWRLANDSITTRNVHMEGNGMALEGSGTVGLTGPGRLNYQGVAEITAKQNALTNLLANFSGATFARGKLGVPFTLEGTLEKPLFRLKTSEEFGKALAAPGRNGNQTQQNLQNLFNLFKRKK